MATGFARKGRQRLRFLICAAWTPLVVLVLAGADPAAARTATSQISSPIATRGALSRLQVNPLLQQGPKLLGRSSEFSDAGWFGSEVALSANGSGTATVTITPTSGALITAVQLACAPASLPAGMTCSFSPATIPAGSLAATSTLTLQTAAPLAVKSQSAAPPQLQRLRGVGGIDALPTTFLIDRQGRIAAIHIGLADRRDIEDGVERLLQAPQPAGSGGGALTATPAGAI